VANETRGDTLVLFFGNSRAFRLTNNDRVITIDPGEGNLLRLNHEATRKYVWSVPPTFPNLTGDSFLLIFDCGAYEKVL
jgi:hypothetical protein